MPKVLRTPEADLDLSKIWVYVAERNYDAAENLLAEINAAAETLAEFPGPGPVRDDLAAGMRSYPVGKYPIFYALTEGGIEARRVIHGSRNLKGIFSK